MNERIRKFGELLDVAGERAALAYLSTLSGFRYVSVIYYDGDHGHPVHHYDRQNPDVVDADELQQQMTYCNTVLQQRRPLEIADSLADARLRSHPARKLVRAYYGVPLFAEDGSAHAVLCHYDHVPQETSSLDHDLLQHAAQRFQSRLARYGTERAVSTAETVYTEQVGSSTFHVVKHTRAEWEQPRYSVERTRTRPDGTVTPRIAYGQGIKFGQGGFSSFEEAQEFGREWCQPSAAN